ncbi:TonB-dependent receptor [Sphingomonas cannabina]|uniref:TonB-dependent receptor domain-containing protein n=1 Tax=Sphingomonas cannabina TaxID=2899123 RepID=UPI001F412438|nr:TonB-dependent receptor [Sphingomonas cannabina]UIJ46699.1 TonB-dependent receptor [Sphingomonas cannabina]
MKSSFLSATALAGTLLLAPSAVSAQATQVATGATVTAPQEDQSDESQAANNEEIVVTGSRLLRPNDTSIAPITSITRAELFSTGNLSVGDALNQLPALRSTFSQSNSTRFIGTAGINAMDLLGLGTARTLTLVNGRRHVTSTPGINRVDVNNVPADLLERVDVIIGSASSIYGSDAVAGVVNYVLRRDFEGITGRAQGGISDRGDRGSYFVSLTAGKNFSEGRGNVTLSAEYAVQNAVYYTDRDDYFGAFSGRNQFNAYDNTVGEPSTGDGIPDNVFLRGVRNINISEGGLYTSACPANTPANAARRALNCTGQRSNTGAELGYTFVFMPDGTLARNNVIEDLRVYGSSNSVGGLGSTLRLSGQLLPKLDRKAINFLSHYEVSEAFVPFLEGKYIRVDSVQEGQPTFFNNTFSINNPFLTSQARALLVSSLAPGATTFTAQRFNIDFGGRGEDHQREVFQITGGASGTFNEDWGYELSVNYGKLKTYYETEGNIDSARYGRAINAVRNTAGNIVCAVNADASSANDDPACVPLNLFGYGAPSQAALDYVTVKSSRRQRAELLDITGFVRGDLSQLFSLPGGPIGFAFGGEYREETAFAAYDAFTAAGNTFLNAIPDFAPPKLKVKEAFGEVRIPLLADMPFFKELSFEGSARVSDYNIGRTGTVWTWSVGGTWAPVQDLRFRASYGKSVRAPTQSDLYASPSQTYLTGLIDPCSATQINNNPNRVRNCAAAGVPTTEVVGGVTVPWTNTPASGVRGLNGSNPNLDAERGTSFTVGAVLKPRWIPGFTLSVDYYNVTIDNVIFSLGSQTIINQCYDSPSGIDNQYCAAVFRRPDGTFFGQFDRMVGGSTVSYQVGPTEAAFLSGPFNFAKQKTSGINVDLAYNTPLDDGVRLSLRGIVSYVIRRDNYTDINTPSFINRQLFELGDPRWEANLSSTLDFGGFDLTYKMRYIGPQTIGTYETQFSWQGRPPENPDAYANPWYPRVFYHDIRVGAKVGDRYRIYAGVDNITDRLPPYGLDGTTEGSGIYDNVGRFFYAGVEVKF